MRPRQRKLWGSLYQQMRPRLILIPHFQMAPKTKGRSLWNLGESSRLDNVPESYPSLLSAWRFHNVLKHHKFTRLLLDWLSALMIGGTAVFYLEMNKEYDLSNMVI